MNGQLYLYADDSSIFYNVRPGQSAEVTLLIKQDMENLARWSNKWKLDFKASKSCEGVFHARHCQPENHPQIYLKGEIIERSAFHKHLGFILDESLTFEQHMKVSPLISIYAV
jgi:hypothetical protein